MNTALIRTRLGVVVLGCVGWPLLLFAQVGQELSLSDALQRARAQQPALEAIRLEREALGYRVDTARLAPPLAIGVELENVAGTGQLRGTQSAELTLSLSSVLELGGKAPARAGLAGAENSLRELQLLARERDLLGDVALRFLDVAEAQARLQLAQHAEQLSERALSSSRRRVDAGAAPATEAQRSQMQRQSAALDVAVARRALNSARQLLSLAIGEPDLEIGTVRADLERLAPPAPLTDLLTQVPTAVDVMAEGARLQVAEAQLRLARAGARSDLGWSVGARHSQSGSDQSLVAGLSLPLGSAGRAEPEIRRQSGLSRAAVQEKQAAELRTRALVLEAWSALNNAAEEHAALGGGLRESADAVVAQTEQGYQRGRYSLLELTAAQQDALAVRQRGLAAAVQYHRIRIELERLLGVSLAGV